MEQNKINYEEEENDILYELDEMLPCDFSGFCSGASCPRFFQCQE